MRILVFFYLLIQLLFFNSCSAPVDDDFIINNRWMHDSGYKFEHVDFIYFIKESPFSYKNDTIYFHEVSIGVIEDVNYKYNEIKIKNITNGEIGIYVNLNYWKE